MSPLPANWSRLPLSEISSVPEQRVPGRFERFRYIDIASIDRDRKVIYEAQELMGESAPSRARKVVRAGDVLVSMTRPNLNAVALVPPELDGHIASTGFDVLRPKGVDPRWLYYLVRSQAFVEEMSGLVQGALYPAVRSRDVRAFIAPVAPLAEQKRIAAKLDRLLAAVDSCKARLNAIPAILKRFRRSVLAAAVSGELTEKWGGNNSSTVNWKTIALGDYVINHDSARVPVSEKDRANRRGRYPYYGASGIIDAIDAFTHDGTYLLIGEDGANLLARSKQIAFIARGRFWVNNHAHVLKCGSEVETEYLCHFMNSIDLSPYVTGSAQPKLSQQNMNRIPIRVPPFDEQEKIVSMVRSLLSFAERIESKLAEVHVERLTSALLARAFRGELVPQDPADEPADALIERIKVGRGGATHEISGRNRVVVTPTGRINFKASQAAENRSTQVTSKVTRESLVDAVRAANVTSLTFDELRKIVRGDYESIREVLFDLLSDPRSGVRQRFDTEVRQMVICVDRS